jgi:hypothetical protein
VNLLVQPYHYKEGDLNSSFKDPLALALKEKLELDIFKEEIVAVGDEEIFLVRGNHSYICEFDVNAFHGRTQDRPRSLTLKFVEV